MLDEGRLARAVLAEDGDGLARFDGQRRRRGRPRCRWGSGGRGRRMRRGPGARSRAALQAWCGAAARRGLRRSVVPAAAAGGQRRPRSQPRRRPRQAASRRPAPAGRASGRRAARSLAARPAPRPATSSAIDPARVEHQAAGPSGRARSGRARRTGSRTRPGPARRAGPPPRPCRPGRAGPSARRGRGPACPSHDARDGDPLLLAAGQCERLAIGEVADRQPLQRRVDPRVHLVAGTPRFSSPKASSSRTVCFDADSWLAGVAKTMPTRPRSAPPARWPRRWPSIATRPLELGPDDARDEPGSGERQRGLAGAGPTGDADALAGRERRRSTPSSARLAAARVADASGRRSERRGTVARRRPRLVIAATTRERDEHDGDGCDHDEQPQPAVDGGSATTR